MTELGEGAGGAEIADEETEGLYFLQFRLVNENGQPVAKIPYKAVKSGSSAEPDHIAEGETTLNGLTGIVSTIKDEEVDLYIVWAKLIVNKGWIKA